jgi:hypothetical protein
MERPEQIDKFWFDSVPWESWQKVILEEVIFIIGKYEPSLTPIIKVFSFLDKLYSSSLTKSPRLTVFSIPKISQRLTPNSNRSLAPMISTTLFF